MVDVQNSVGDSPLHLAVWFGNHDCVRHLLDYSAPVDLVNAHGLDSYQNVMARSPLAQKRKIPSELRRSLALVFDRRSGGAQPDVGAQSSASADTDRMAHYSSHDMADTGSAVDEFHDCDDDNGAVLNATSSPPVEVTHALHARKGPAPMSQSNIQPPVDVALALEMRRRELR